MDEVVAKSMMAVRSTLVSSSETHISPAQTSNKTVYDMNIKYSDSTIVVVGVVDVFASFTIKLCFVLWFILL